MDPETDPEAYSADLSRPSVRAALAALALFRLAVDGIVSLAENVAGLCVLGWLLAHGQIGGWHYQRVDDEAKVRAALEFAGREWSSAEQVRAATGLTARRSGSALGRLVKRGRVDVRPPDRGFWLRRYRLKRRAA